MEVAVAQGIRLFRKAPNALDGSASGLGNDADIGTHQRVKAPSRDHIPEGYKFSIGCSCERYSHFHERR